MWKQPPEELRHNLNNPYALVNHNLIFKCEAKAVDWFEVFGGFATKPDGTQVPYCTVRARRNPPTSKIPANLVITAILSSNESKFNLAQVFTYPYHFEFLINDKDRSLELNPEYPVTNITIDTNEELLLAELTEGVSSYFNPELRQQHIRVDLSNSKTVKRMSLRIRNPITNQQETIAVRYDPSGRGRPTEGAAWATWNFKWTDYVVVVMIVVLVLAFLNWRADETRPKSM